MWQRIKQSMQHFMMGRHGTDALSMDLLWYGIGFFVLSIVIGLFQTLVAALLSRLFSWTALVCYGYSLVRAFSRNNAKRDEQNTRYLAWKSATKTKFRQAKTRMNNRKEYKYFRCPHCKTWIRLPRGKGIVTVTCRHCKTNFTQKS